MFDVFVSLDEVRKWFGRLEDLGDYFWWGEVLVTPQYFHLFNELKLNTNFQRYLNNLNRVEIRVN